MIMEIGNNNAKEINYTKATDGGRPKNKSLDGRPTKYLEDVINPREAGKSLLGSDDKPGPIKREDALKLRGYKVISIEDKILTVWKETSDRSNYIIECQINFGKNTVKFSEEYPSGSRPHAASLGDIEVMLDILIAKEFMVKFND